MVKKNTVGTEMQIKKAAAKLFIEKGFDATSTREIADASGSNVALINYYYRSKQHLYEVIVMEAIGAFFEPMMPIFDNKETSLNDKFEELVGVYTDFLLKHRDLPLFVITEMRRNPDLVMKGIPLETLKQTSFYAQVVDKLGEDVGGLPYFGHLILNVLGMLMMPMLVAPVAKKMTGLDQQKFVEAMNIRKCMLPLWINTMAELAE